MDLVKLKVLILWTTRLGWNAIVDIVVLVLVVIRRWHQQGTVSTHKVGVLVLTGQFLFGLQLIQRRHQSVVQFLVLFILHLFKRAAAFKLNLGLALRAVINSLRWKLLLNFCQLALEFLGLVLSIDIRRFVAGRWRKLFLDGSLAGVF